MGKLIKFLALVALVAALAGGGSYAAAYFAQGKITGVDDPIGARTVKLEWKGIDSLPGKPRAWVFTYSGGKIQGIPRATIWVTPGGDVIATKPRDLQERIERWRDAQQSAD
jgi:YD repeat-containing protein